MLAFSRGGTVKRSVLTYRIRRGTKRTIYLAWINYPGRRTLTVDAARYDRARRAVTAYWNGRLQEGTQIDVPERRVNDAYRNLVIQNLLLTWRYSIGNPYEQFSFPEGVDVAEVMGELGYAGVARSIMRTSLTRKDAPYPNWKAGKRLIGSALHYRLTRDRAYIEGATPTLRRYVDELGRQIADGGTGLLGRERYSSDIDEQVLGLHSQATVWQGLAAMGRVWAETGNAGARAALRDARRAARGGPAAGGRLLAAAARRRLAVRAGAAARPRARLRLADRGEARQLLEPRDAVRARIRALRPRQPGGDRDPQVHAPARLAPRRRRPRRRLRALRAAGLPRLRHRPGLRDQRRPLPRRRRRGRPARAQPLRLAGDRDDAEHVRLGRGGERRAARRQALPLDVPAAERGEQRRVPGDAQVAARPRDPRRRGRADRARARVRDAAAVAARRPPDRRSPRADELRPRHVLARGAERHDPRDRGAAGAAGSEDAEAPRSAAARPARRGGDGEREAARAAGGRAARRDDRPQRARRPARGDRPLRQPAPGFGGRRHRRQAAARPLHRPRRPPEHRGRGAAGVVRARRQPAAAADHLTARPRPERARELDPLGQPARPRLLRRDQPGRPRQARGRPLLGLRRPRRGSRADAGDPADDAALAADRPAEGLRLRRQHGRPGDAAARWPGTRGCSPAPRPSPPSPTWRSSTGTSTGSSARTSAGRCSGRRGWARACASSRASRSAAGPAAIRAPTRRAAR